MTWYWAVLSAYLLSGLAFFVLGVMEDLEKPNYSYDIKWWMLPRAFSIIVFGWGLLIAWFIVETIIIYKKENVLKNLNLTSKK